MKFLYQLVNTLNWEVECDCCGQVYDPTSEKVEHTSDASTAKSANDS